MSEREPVGIAIVGMSGRFPGAADIRAFWANLQAGVESIQRFGAAELDDAFDATVRTSPDFVAARGVLADVDLFDAGFFGMHAREAALTDPQHRIFLECAWEALEDAGYDPTAFAGTIGVVAGASISTYLLRNVLHDRTAVERFASDYQVASYPELLGGGADFLATRVAYKLNLRGPALTVQTACSTSLVAVAQACQTLLLRQADMMLAGGVAISFPQQRGYLHQDGGIVSADGHCRTFDEHASGTVFGAGAGAVLLKRLDDAVAAGDTIYAVIRGFGINNDGAAKAGYMAPSAAGQAAAIRAAHAMAAIDPRTIRFVECHGTATPLGDPIEVSALRKAFPPSDDGRRYCALGSVKTNIGHLDIAAGMSGLIKTALVVQQATIPATLHFTRPNPRIPFDGSPFFVAAERCDWPADAQPRRAGVSAFGVGGTNVHLVLEQAPAREPVTDTGGGELLVLSARSEAALSDMRARLAEHLHANPQLALSDVAFTLQAGRRAFAHRAAISAASLSEAVERLTAPAAPALRAAASAPGIAFMFPGQGAQYADMGRGLYTRYAVFRSAVDRCGEILAPILGIDLRELLYPPAGAPVAREALTPTALAQPAIFTVEYALAQLWQSWNITPAAMIGHSVGEFAAATIAGVFALEDALAVVADRGRLMQSVAPGAMLAVRLPSAELEPLLGAPLGLAAANSPVLSVAAGPPAEIARLERELSARGAAFRRLDTSHAFHSPMMDAVIAPLVERIARVPLSEPRIPYVSGVSGDWITAAQATSPEYWARHCREPVRFAAGVATLCERVSMLLEAGPGNALATFARQGAGKTAGATVVDSLPGARRERDDVTVMLTSLGRLWCAGAQPAWPAPHAGATPTRTPLPTYPFERARHWLDRAAPPAAPTTPSLETHVPQTPAVPPPAAAALGAVQRDIIALLEELSGETIAAADSATTFLELGFDSLFLGRLVQRLAARFNVALTFRQLLGDLPTIAAVSAHVAATLPAPAVADGASAPPAAAPAVGTAATPANRGPAIAFAPLGPPARTQTPAATGIESIVRDQLATMQQLMRDQLQAVQQLAAHSESQPPTHDAPSVPATSPVPVAAMPTVPVAAAGAAEPPSRFEVFRPGSNGSRTDMTPVQRAHIDALIARTTARTPRSKALAQRYRAVLADPRVAAGFRAEWKEMVYQITCDRAQGARLWDIDGNAYIDILNGFGQTALGHSPQYVVDAVADQLQRGFPIGPQTELAGQVAELFCELTGNERVTFCNTGSEAVMAALRVARTVTGRSRVVTFSGAYHGQFDEVLVRGARTSERAQPVAAGIPAESVANMVVLAYADPASLQWIREHAAELAAVVVEPVQSRHPALQPAEFLRELRTITAASGTALVFDEVVTGFRIHPAGLQHVFGVRADLATYGKVAGGGMPIGILAGTARFMDALDGGMWQYGDDSQPDVPPTFFAGTFVRHPLTMAAVLAVLRHLKAEGPALQDQLSARTADLVERLNADLDRRGLPCRIETCGSIFYFNFTPHERLASLLYYHLRLRGVYIQEGYPCFLTSAHSAADIDVIAQAFTDSFDELQSVGIFMSAQDGAPRDGAPRAIPLTEEQTEIWLAAQLSDDASCAFNESIALRLSGPLDGAVFTRAWNAIVARHDALRITFTPTGESMHVGPAAGLPFALTDLSASPPDEAHAALSAIVAREAATPFDLVAGPPVRATLVRLQPDVHVFVLVAHHIVCDGWSINVILEDFAALYRAGGDVRQAALPPPLEFARYARTPRDPAELGRVEAFWLATYREPVTPLDLPTDRPRPAIRTYRGATRRAHIDAGVARTIKAAGARAGCTLFVTLLTAFKAVVARLADAEDIVIGVPAAGQALLEPGRLVGHCVDFLPIRTHVHAQMSTAQVLTAVKTSVLGAYEHQDYTLGTLVRKLALPRATNRIALAEIQFNLERIGSDLELPELRVEFSINPKAFVNFDLFLNVIEADDGLRIDCDYNTDLFDSATIDRWLRDYAAVLDALVAGTPILAPAPAAPAVAGPAPSICRDTVADYPRDATLLSLIGTQVARRPDAVAACCADERLTYAALDRRVNALAQHLRARIGSAGTRVGVAVDRSLDLLVALLATLKAGYAYVPLDPTHPPARLRHILTDARISALIIDDTADIAMAPGGIPLVHLDRDRDTIAAAPGEPPAIPSDPDGLAYAIYTSGSTGVPKGVEITQRAVVNFLCSMRRQPGFTENDTLLAVTTVAFDIAALELFLPLVCGGTVAIATSAETRDGFALKARLKSYAATAMQATPATWSMLLEAGFRCPAGFRALCGGEALRRDLADRLLTGESELWNMYGPTETTIWSACARVTVDGPIDVGRPIANTQLYILDDGDAAVACGAPGHLHIGGDGVARGYIARPELTAQRFVPNPFDPGRMYRTGDLARMRPDGTVEILGRIDDQVKLRGFRIELGEIESILARHGALAAVTVARREDRGGPPRLVAYYVDRPSAPTSAAALRDVATLHLPDYMIPSAFVRLDALPLNPNGKVDRAALPVPPEMHAGDYHAAQTPTEMVLAEIWASVLGRDRIGTTDDIFELGADSIQIFQITARANRRGLPILAKHVLRHRTIDRIARFIDDAGVAGAPAVAPQRPPLPHHGVNGVR